MDVSKEVAAANRRINRRIEFMAAEARARIDDPTPTELAQMDPEERALWINPKIGRFARAANGVAAAITGMGDAIVEAYGSIGAFAKALETTPEVHHGPADHPRSARTR
jgi:hypothetical protein